MDADFAGAYSSQDSESIVNLSSVRSRTGYISSFANAPLLWVSKLQGEVALSTTESEYIALSHSLCDALPTQQVLFELSSCFSIKSTKLILRCDVYEDNAGAIELASNPKYRPRTKHIAVKYHHFRERVEHGDVVVKKISTHLQKADLLTKALGYTTFKRLRGLVMGW